MAMVENDLEKGTMQDWGAFPGENRGYLIFEGSNLELMKMTGQYTPYVAFETHPVANVLEVKDFLKTMAG
jgi:hypothetical protein